MHLIRLLTALDLCSALVVTAAAGGCRIASPLRCDVDDDCPAGMRCLIAQHACVAPPSVEDAGLHDATVVDAADAAVVDAADAATDASAVDVTDAAVVDTAAADAASDASAVDATDAAVVDAAAPPCDAGHFCALDVEGVVVFSRAPERVVAPRIVSGDAGAFAALAALLHADGGAADGDPSGTLELAALTVDGDGLPGAEVMRVEAHRRAPFAPGIGYVAYRAGRGALAAAVANTSSDPTRPGQLTLGAPGQGYDPYQLLSAPSTRALIFDLDGDDVEEIALGADDGRSFLVVGFSPLAEINPPSTSPVSALALYCDPDDSSPWPPILIGKQGSIEIKRYTGEVQLRYLHCGSHAVTGTPSWLAVGDFLGAAQLERVIAALFAEPAQTRLALFTLASSGPCTQADATYFLSPLGAELVAERGISGTPAVARRSAGGDAIAVVADDGTLVVAAEVGGAPVLSEHATGLAPVHAGVVALDLDGDGDDEVVGVSADGRLFALELDGAPVSARWPLPLAGGSTFSTTPAAGELDGDPATLELVVLDDSGGAHLVRYGLAGPAAGFTWPGENGDRGATACVGAADVD